MSQKRSHEDAEHSAGPQSQAARITKIRACAECKRHKIKCEPVAGEQKCSKCLRSNLECIPHNPNQRFHEEDALWKANATAELSQLRSAVQVLLRHNQLPDLASVTDKTPTGTIISPLNASENGAHTTMIVPPMDMTRENSVESDLGEESELVPAPMRSLYDLTRIRNLRSHIGRKTDTNSMEDDFIGQGIISESEAETLFTSFMENMYQLLWAGMLVPHYTLHAVRLHSTLLTAAILAISAMHTPGRGEALQKCYNVFVTLTYSACLARVDSLDDIRALCLAAFYLSNLSYKLSGLAVRNAIEMNIHQAFHKLMRGHADQRDNVRLWYAVYVCERQFSIAYGRPPLLHEDVATKNIERFLDSPHTTPGDIRLCAQVTLFKILTEAYMTFGSDPEQPLTEADFQQLRMFNFAIEQWRLLWQPRSADSAPIGSYPSKGVVLYYHFARFQLNSLALRALPPPSAASSETLSYDRREAANIAISAATSTLTLIFEEPDLRRAMTAVPIFTHTMVAFCATFLLKMAKTWGGVAQAASPEWATEPLGLGLNFNISQVLSLSRRSANFLAKVADSLNDKHLTKHIARGIKELLKHFDTPETPASTTAPPHSRPDTGETRPVETLNGIGGSGPAIDFTDGYNMYDLIGSYGFGFDETFLGQAASSDFDLWPS
ncbi:hypothetical protein K458DRAFT_438307 [Lentithecium fluviatile CBS 122367]|uniref:Zn(2)-C6 fungal-type domain-containing protein n=1 Tax=Lentithecium fluviatile CBS 122367 TaxID=1168545 RepID=A0A6G1JPL0_9PLEO|nr:hypothetical protein K458DRAFT_438307 [Lentithecium fluviatile CBS 122367]